MNVSGSSASLLVDSDWSVTELVLIITRSYLALMDMVKSTVKRYKIFTFSDNSGTERNAFIDNPSEEVAKDFEISCKGNSNISIKYNKDPGFTLYKENNQYDVENLLSEDEFSIVIASSISKTRLQRFQEFLEKNSEVNDRFIFVILGEFGDFDSLDSSTFIKFSLEDWKHGDKESWRILKDRITGSVDVSSKNLYTFTETNQGNQNQLHDEIETNQHLNILESEVSNLNDYATRNKIDTGTNHNRSKNHENKDKAIGVLSYCRKVGGRETDLENKSNKLMYQNTVPGNHENADFVREFKVLAICLPLFAYWHRTVLQKFIIRTAPGAITSILHFDYRSMGFNILHWWNGDIEFQRGSITLIFISNFNFWKWIRNQKKPEILPVLPIVEKTIFSGLKNTKETCYLNAMIQAMASSPKLLSQFDVLVQKNQGNQIQMLTDILRDINEPIENGAEIITANIIEFLNAINWNRKSQQDTFQLLSWCINAVQRDIQYSEKTMPPKLKILHSFTANASFNKVQDHLGLSIPLCGNFREKPGEDLNMLMDAFFAPSLIDDGPNSTSLYLFEKAPEVLILHIQANEWDNKLGMYIKPQYHIKYEKTLTYTFDIKMDKNMSSSKKIEVEYELMAVVRHMGNVSGGHYITYRRHGHQWFLANDEQVEAINFEFQVVPYVMVYDKVKEKAV